MVKRWTKVMTVLFLACSNMTFAKAETHTHDATCYAKEGELLCTLSEEDNHTHTEDCYAKGDELICENAEDDAQMMSVDPTDEDSATGNDQEGHTHTEECYANAGDLLCTLSEDENHTHTEDCYAEGGELICENGDEFKPMLLNDETITDFASLQSAINNATDGEETELVIANDVEFTDTLFIPSGKNIVLKSEVTFSTSAAVKNKPMIKVEEGASLCLDGNLTMNGENAQSFVNCLGNLTLNNATLEKCSISTSNNHIGGVTVTGANASFTMNGGTIQNVTSNYGLKGAVYVYDNAKFVMNGGSVKNNSFDNQFCAAVFIDDAEFEMNDGEITGNKTDVSQLSSAGGVMVMGLGWGQTTTSANAKSSSFVMNGGKISGNESNRGGGVYVMGGSINYTDLYSKAYFTMNGGEISGNTTRNYSNSSVNIVSAGAGIYVEWAGEVTMNGGTICDNATEGMGGGVATNDAFTNYFGKNPYSSAGDSHYYDRYYKNWPDIFPASFTMNGGSIVRNKATSTSVLGDQGCGGGIYIASDRVELNAGDISDNISGKQGGGVYVGSVPYVLTLKDALITGNSASVIGGGVWLCPTGEINASVNNGSAVYGNTADGAADDFAALHTVANYTASIATHMLGGGLANWYQDGALKRAMAGDVLGTADNSVARYVEGSSDNIAISDTSSLTGFVSMKSVPSTEAQTAAKAAATLTITGNKSARGGGIGSNGNVVLGDSFDVTRDLTLNKKWASENGIQDTVTVWILIDGLKTQSVTLTKADGWTTTVKGLPINGEITVAEEDVAGWKATYAYETSADGDITATITNSPKEPVTVTLSATKTLDGKTPTSNAFRFTLTDANGKTLETVTNNGETIQFSKLSFDQDGTYTYRISEVKGNNSRIQYDEAVFEVTITVNDQSKAEVTIKKSGQSVNAIVFENKTTEIPKKPPVPNTADE